MQPSQILQSTQLIKKILCGISDKTNKDHHAKLVKKLIPSAQKIGIIYTADEAHTQEQLDELVSSMKKAKLTPYTINLREKNPQSKYRKLDALFILEDNIIASSMKDLTQQALKTKSHFLPAIHSPSPKVLLPHKELIIINPAGSQANTH